MPRGTATNSLTNYDADLAKLAALGSKTAAARAGTLAKTIGTQGAHFTIEGKMLKDTKMDVVVVDFVLMNTLYKPGTKFDPKNPTSPICYAFGREEEEMGADANSSLPQGGTKYESKGGTPGRPCGPCWANEWESSDTGKGKACKNGIRLALITADSLKSVESIAAAEIRYLAVPVTSGKAWAAHTKSVQEAFNLPVLGVVTTVEISPAEGGGHRLDFETLQEVDKKVIGALLEKHKAAAKEIDFPFVKPEDIKRAPGAKDRIPAKQTSRPSSKNMGDAAAGKRATKY